MGGNMNESIYSIEKIKNIVVPVLKQHKVKKAVLFGSYAKQCATEHSDIDIYIDSGGVLNGLNFFTVYNDIESCLNKKVDLIEALDIDKGSKIHDEITEYGVILYE